jgi:hypothetical protein
MIELRPPQPFAAQGKKATATTEKVQDYSLGGSGAPPTCV